MAMDGGILEKIIEKKLHKDKETLISEIKALEAENSNKAVWTFEPFRHYVVYGSNRFNKYRVYYDYRENDVCLAYVIKDSEAVKRDSDALNNKDNVLGSFGNLIKLIFTP